MSPKSFRLHRVHGSIAGLLVFCIFTTLSSIATETFGETQPVTSSTASAQIEVTAPTSSISQTQELPAAQIPQGQAVSKESSETPADPEKIFEQGLQCYQNKDFPGALQHFNNVLALDGAHSGALKYQKLAQKAVGSSRQKPVAVVQESQPEVPSVEDTTRLQAESLYREGVALYKQKQYGEARDKFAESLSLLPEYKQSQKYLATTEKALADEESRRIAAAEKQAQIEAQQIALQQAQQQEAEIASMIQQGQEQLTAGDYEAAQNTFAAVLERDPRHSKARSYQKQAVSLYEKQQVSLAKAREAEEAQAKQESIDNLVATGSSLMQANEYDKAIDAFQQARVIDPEDRKLYSYVLKAEAAKEQAERDIERQEAQAQELQQKQLALEQQQAERQAQEAFDGLLSSGRSNLRQGLLDEAIADFEKALALDAESSNASSLLARARQAKDEQIVKQQEQARLDQERAQALQIQEQESAQQEKLALQFNEALALYQQKDYATAKDRFAALLETDSTYPKANRYLQLAIAGEENERRLIASREMEIEKARQREEEIARRAAIDQNYSDGVAAFKARDYETAVSFFENVLEIQANHRSAGRYLNKAQVALEEQQRQIQNAPTLLVSEPETSGGLLIASAETEMIQPVVEHVAERPLPTQPRVDPFTIVQADIVVPEPVSPFATQPSEMLIREEAQETVDVVFPVQDEAPVPMLDMSSTEVPLVQELPVTAPEIGADERVRQHLVLGRAYLEAKLYEEAQREFAAALELDPENVEIAQLLAECESGIQARSAAETAKAERAVTVTEDRAKAQAAGQLEKGKEEYSRGNVIPAVKYFQEALELDPNNVEAANYLKLTQDEYATAVEATKVTQQYQEKDEEYQKRLAQVIPSLSLVESPIDEVLGILATISGFNIVAGEGVDGVVTVHIKDKTVGDALALILKPNGFTYERDGADIVVRLNLTTRIFQLQSDTYKKLEQVLYDPNNVTDPALSLQQILYGDMRRPNIPGKLLRLNPRTLQLIVTDTEESIQKVEEFLRNIPELTQMSSPLITRLFALNPDIAKRIYDIIELMLYEGQKPQAIPQGEESRQLLLEKDTNVLIVKDTEDNIQKVEEILKDQAILERLQREELVARRFKVSTEDDFTEDGRIRRSNEVKSVEDLLKTMLYTTEGREESIAKGRRMYPNYEQGTIDIVDTPDNIKKVERFLASVRGESQDMKIFPIKHADVDALAQRLNTFSGRRMQGDTTYDYDDRYDNQTRIPSRIITVPESHMIIVRAAGPALDMFTNLVEILDVAPEQVEIETRLIEVGLRDLRQMGIDWTLTNLGEEGLHWGRHDGSERSQLDIGMINQFVPDGMNLAFQILGETELDVMLTLLSRAESVNVLSAPKLVTLSSPGDVNPSIDITTSVPFISSAEVDTHATDTPADDTIIFNYATEDVGITMEVNPIVSGDGAIIMTINPVVSVLSGRLPVVLGTTGAVAELGQPIIDTRTASTRVRVRDGETIVIGGLIREEETTTESRVPYLSNIPKLGILFKDTKTETDKRTLLIFVTARILKM